MFLIIQHVTLIEIAIWCDKDATTINLVGPFLEFTPTYGSITKNVT